MTEEEDWCKRQRTEDWQARGEGSEGTKCRAAACRGRFGSVCL